MHLCLLDALLAPGESDRDEGGDEQKSNANGAAGGHGGDCTAAPWHNPLVAVELPYAEPSTPKSPKPPREPAAERCFGAWCAGLTLLGMLAYWTAMFVICRPALKLTCGLGLFLPWLFTGAWLYIAGGAIQIVREHELSRRQRGIWLAIAAIALFLVPYSFFRADNDVFALALRKKIADAGGAEALRRELTEWQTSLPTGEDQEAHSQRLHPFHTAPPGGGNITRRPSTEVPPGLDAVERELGNWFPASNINGTLTINGIEGLNTIYLNVDAADVQPRSIGVWPWLTGSARELAPGVRLRVGIYSK